MNVVCLNASYCDSGNGAAALRAIARGLAARGHDVTVVALRESTPQAGVRTDGVRLIGLGCRPDPDHEPRLRQLIAGRAPDVVCVHDLDRLGPAAWRACASAGVPVAQVLHDSRLVCGRRAALHAPGCDPVCGPCVAGLPELRELSAGVDAVVGVSRAVLRAHLVAGLFAGARYEAVVEPALDLAAAPVPPRHRPRLEFGYRGPLGAGSGVAALCAGFARLHALHGDAIRLSIGHAGGPGDAGHDAALRTRFGSAGGIEFVGAVDGYDFCAGLDLSIAPAEWEVAWPAGAIESIGYGVPVVAARRGALAEVVRPGVNGMLFEPERPDGLVAALGALIAEPRRIRAMHRRCRPSIARLLDTARMVDEHEEVIHALTLPRREHAERLMARG